jgi:hypothetical protein
MPSLHESCRLSPQPPTRTSIVDMPAVAPNLPRIETLDLHGNRLASVPEYLSQFTTLRELGLGNNLIRSIPAQLSTLTDLRHLNILGNPGLDASSLPPRLKNAASATVDRPGNLPISARSHGGASGGGRSSRGRGFILPVLMSSSGAEDNAPLRSSRGASSSASTLRSWGTSAAEVMSLALPLLFPFLSLILFLRSRQTETDCDPSRLTYGPMEPLTLNPQPSTLSTQHSTLNPKPSTPG